MQQTLIYENFINSRKIHERTLHMQKNNYIKLNDTNDYLSIGNFFRVIKEESNCKNTFLQSEFFCSLFDIQTIADSTVNNYLTGFRAINSIYKEKIIKKKNNFIKDSSSFLPTIYKIMSVLENKLISGYPMDEINNNIKLYNVCSTLYDIAKNDLDIPKQFLENIHSLLNANNLFEFTANVFFFVVLDKKQPVSFENKLMKSINDTLKHTNISPNQITDFMNTQLEESMWSSLRKINELAKGKNAFACLQMAFYEFYGLIAGYPRYIKSYEYYKIAANQSHPAANWAIGHMYYNGYIGNKSNEELLLAFDYFSKAKDLGSAAAINSLGIIYLEGKIQSIPKNLQKAVQLFNEAISKGNVFALNNLGKIYESEGKYNKALELFERSANVGESWAANKVGEYYRIGKYVKKDMEKAFYYYNKSDESSVYFMCPWSKYNLAKYFYENGNEELSIEPDINKAIELLELASTKIIGALEELIIIYYKKYLGSNKQDKSSLEKLKYYIEKIENSPSYSLEIKNKIQTIMDKIYNESTSIQFKY